MAITVDGSTPAGFGAGASATSITSAAFTPPVGSRIILLFGADSNAGETTNVTTTGTGGDAITFAKSVRNSGLYAEVWISDPCPTAISRTVTASVSGGGGATLLWAQPLVLNGVDPTTPLGATGFNASANTANVANPTAYTSTVDNSLCVFVAMDDSNNGAPTTTDVGFAATTTGESWLAGYKAAATTPSGSTVSINLDAAGTNAATWWWAAAEILPAVGGATAPTQPVLTATPNVGPSMHLSWTVPSNGGSAITDALVEVAPDVSGSAGTYSTFTHSALGTTAAIDVTGLTAGNWYWFRVSAINAIGTSTASTAVRARSSEDIVPSTKPRFAFPTKAPGRVRRIQATRGVNRAQATADDIAALVFGAVVSNGTGSAVINNTFNVTAVGATTPKGSAVVNNTFNVTAVGKRTPKGSATINNEFDATAVGKRVPKGSATISDAFDVTAIGKQVPKGSATVTNEFDPTAIGKRTPKGSAVITNSFDVSATGVAPVVGGAAGSAIITNTWNVTAVGQRTPKGSALITNGFDVVVTGKRVPKGTASLLNTFNPTGVGKRVPKGSAIIFNDWVLFAQGVAPLVGVNQGSALVTTLWTVTADGVRHPVGSAVAEVTWSVTAVGVAPVVQPHLGSAIITQTWQVVASGARPSLGAAVLHNEWTVVAIGTNAVGLIGKFGDLAYVDWQWEAHPIVDWLVGS